MNTFRKIINTTYWVLLTLALSTCSEPELPKPEITSVDPIRGPVGTPVTITGNNLSSAQSVQFGSATSAIASGSGKEIVTVVPPGLAPGDATITVKTDGGISNSILFTVIPGVPEITSLEPDEGSSGMEVTIHGNHLAAASSVSFGGVSITSFVSNTDTALKITVPENLDLGALDVTVTTAGGTSAKATFTVLGKPLINGVSPLIGPVGRAVSITGVNFEDASRVYFGTVETTFQVVSASAIETVVPVGAVTAKVKVVTPGGQAESQDDFVVKEAATITDFVPVSGIVGTVVTIHGISLGGDVIVKFGTVNATEVTVVNDTQITAKVPAAAVTGKITVETVVGNAISGNDFIVIGIPLVTTFSPDKGGVGSEVTISGENFIDVSAVSFNSTDVAGANYTVVSSTEIKAKVPAGATTGKISVKTPAGTGSSAVNFTILPPPTIVSFTPAIGSAGKVVTITGTHFDLATQVFFGAVEAAFQIKSATVIDATVPAMAGTGKIKVVTQSGEAVSTENFVVKGAPEITSFSPGSGIVGIEVTINGNNFDAGAVTVKFGTGVSSVVTVVSATKITAVVGATATTGKITVETAAGAVLSATNFTVIGAPAVTLFAPTSGAIGVNVVINGTNFINVSTVKFNNTLVPDGNFTIMSATQINALVPAGASTGKISISTPAGTGTSGTNFTVFPPPTITSFAPAVGPVGTVVTISGTNFIGATKVLVGTLECAFNVNSATEIAATIPASANGGKMKVITPGGEATSATDFVVKAAPLITSFSPGSGIVGATITINGSSFDAGSVTVKFGTGIATAVTVVSPTQIAANVPADATTGKITVQTAAGSALSTSTFTVIGIPTITTFTPLTGSAGVEVTITGTNFINVSSVKIGAVSILTGNYTVVSATQVKATIPGGATTGKISIATPAGTATSDADFTVQFPPTIISFSPTSGALGINVVIMGTNFVNITAVSFNDADVGLGNFTVNSSTQITAKVPSNATAGKIKVSNAAGVATSANNFYITPFISNITPSSGSPGTPITITGTNLGSASVSFNGTIVTPSMNTNTSITVSVPSIGSGGINVTVSNLGGTSNSRSFTVNDPVVINEIVASASVAGQLILISGTNLSGATKVLFGNVEVAILTNTPKVVTAIIPALSVGNHLLKVVTGTGTSNTLNFEMLSSQNPDTGGVSMNGTVPSSIVTLPGGYVPPVTNQWDNENNAQEQFVLNEDVFGQPTGTFTVDYQVNFTLVDSGTGLYDKPNNYVEFTVNGVRYVGFWIPPTTSAGDCFAHMILISTESGRVLQITVFDFENCP